MGNVFSQAGNFITAESGGIDPHNGFFRTSIQLGHLVGNGLRGPMLPFVLGYQPYVEDDYGFGKGWAIGWTSYRTDNNDYGTLYTATGESYKVDRGLNDTIAAQKPPGVGFSNMGDGFYKTTYQSGAVEILGGGANGIYVPSILFSGFGARYSLHWTTDENWISEVLDEVNNPILTVSYDTDVSATITLWPGTSEAVSITAAINNDRQLQSLTMGEWTWTFTYADSSLGVDPLPLTQIVHPTGLVEAAVYGAQHAYPADAGGKPPLPCVTTYTKTPNGGQPPVIVRYTFTDLPRDPDYPGVSEHNFVGYGGTFTDYDSDGSDPLLYCPGYIYQTLCETMSGNTAVSSVVRTFNNFHAMVKEVRTQGKCTSITNIEYGNMVPGATVDDSGP